MDPSASTACSMHGSSHHHHSGHQQHKKEAHKRAFLSSMNGSSARSSRHQCELQ
jgi:hypothetical protein